MSGGYPTRIHGFCSSYGPGRLPKADERDIGAGYAAASAAVVAVALTGLFLSLLGGSLAGFLLASYALPLVVPSAFVIAVVGWRVFEPTDWSAGLLYGFVGVMFTYLLSLTVLFVLLSVATAGGVMGIDPVGGIAAIGFFAVIGSFFLTFPLGSIAGATYVSVART